jgi:hypothetical protein
VVLSWHGARWISQAAPDRGGAVPSALQAVSCASPRACTATGSFARTAIRTVPLAETWNGTRWRIQPAPSPARAVYSDFFAVSCSAPDACTAAGDYNMSSESPARPLGERWNGSTWQIQAVPLPARAKSGSLSGVSCTSPRACITVGSYNGMTGRSRPLAESWNGTTWTVQTAPLPARASGGRLDGVSCTSPRACTATGTLSGHRGGTLAEQWNGSTWRIQAAAGPPGSATGDSNISLGQVSCVSASACTAIGRYTRRGQPLTFAEAWTGTRWSLQATATPPGTVASMLSGVSCAPRRCTAVGTSYGLSGVQVTLAITTSH